MNVDTIKFVRISKVVNSYTYHLAVLVYVNGAYMHIAAWFDSILYIVYETCISYVDHSYQTLFEKWIKYAKGKIFYFLY